MIKGKFVHVEDGLRIQVLDLISKKMHGEDISNKSRLSYRGHVVIGDVVNTELPRGRGRRTVDGPKHVRPEIAVQRMPPVLSLVRLGEVKFFGAPSLCNEVITRQAT